MRYDELDTPALQQLRLQVGDAARERIDAVLEARARVGHEESAPQQRRGVPNKTEAAYMAELRHRPGVVEVMFEAVKLRLADGAWYTPDVLVLMEDGQCELHEVKGFWREAARVRIKVAARLYPHWIFRAVQKRRVKDGGGWKVETFGAATAATTSS